MTSEWFKVAVAAALCVAGAPASASASAQTIKLWQVTRGSFELDKGFRAAKSGVGTKVNAPVTMPIIPHPRGLIAFDTPPEFDALRVNGDFDLFGDGTVTILDTHARCD